MKLLKLGTYVFAALVGASAILATPEVLPAAHCLFQCEECTCSDVLQFCDCNDCTVRCEPN